MVTFSFKCMYFAGRLCLKFKETQLSVPFRHCHVVMWHSVPPYVQYDITHSNNCIPLGFPLYMLSFYYYCNPYSTSNLCLFLTPNYTHAALASTSHDPSGDPLTFVPLSALQSHRPRHFSLTRRALQLRPLSSPTTTTC